MCLVTQVFFEEWPDAWDDLGIGAAVSRPTWCDAVDIEAIKQQACSSLQPPSRQLFFFPAVVQTYTSAVKVCLQAFLQFSHHLGGVKRALMG